jgi:hypothetical protein
MEVTGQLHAPTALSPENSFGTHCVGGQVGPIAGLDPVEKSRWSMLRCRTLIPRSSSPYSIRKGSDWLQAGRPRGRNSSPDRVKNFLFSKSSRPTLGPTQPPIQWVPGALSPGMKQPGREADHSPPTSADVKKMWNYTSSPPILLHGVVLN